MEDPSRDHVGRRLTALWLCALYRRSLHLRCPACQHQRLIDAIPVWWLFKRRRWSETLRDVPPRFYCSRCLADRGRRTRGPRLTISLDPAEPCDLPYPDEREWKRMVSRYRG